MKHLVKVFGITLLLFVVFSFSKLKAQQAVAVLQHSGVASIFTDIAAAVNYAVSGDTIMLSGGIFESTNIEITKKLHIFGVGHYPDSTQATGITLVGGNIILKTGADFGRIQGIYLNGNIIFGTYADDQTVNNYTISRCSVNQIKLSFDGQTSTNSTNLTISENVVRTEIYGGNAQKVVIKKNLVNGQVINFDLNAKFANNIFFYNSGAGYLFQNVTSCKMFNNIIFQAGDYIANAGGNSFENNIFTTANPVFTGNAASNNFLGQTQIFIDQTENVFNYSNNYHLHPQSVGFSAGNDHYDIGIYGTFEPYKDGAVPQTPHFQAKNINTSGAPDQQMLNISIGVKSQKN